MHWEIKIAKIYLSPLKGKSLIKGRIRRSLNHRGSCGLGMVNSKLIMLKKIKENAINL